MALIGITGGIGAGKTAVLNILGSYGARIWDADVAVHELYLPGREGFAAAVQRWGRAVLTVEGGLDRQAVAARVFASPVEREWLEAQVHPLVQKNMEDTAARFPSPLFCAVPLLFEVGWQDRFAAVITVWCDPETQRRRLLARGWTEAEMAARLQAQLPANEKLDRADLAIINNGSLDLLREQCRRVWDILQRAKHNLRTNENAGTH